MKATLAGHATPQARSLLPLMGEPGPRRWEEDIDRAWKSASDEGPGLWRVGLWLSQGFLTSLMARRPWQFQSWSRED